MSRVFIGGMGAVSPAGWTLAALREALAKGEPLPVQALERPGCHQSFKARLVPNPATRPPLLAHPRLRRSSPITHYAAAAALEALGQFQAGQKLCAGTTLPSATIPSAERLGVIVCLQSGCVQYSQRFFEEALSDPATASPLLFPETVFAAPASHVAALLGNTCSVQTLIGDPATFLQGIALGAAWLQEDRVASCLVIGAEEVNWLRADALWHLEHAAVISGGAGALHLCRKPSTEPAVELAAITEAHTYSARKSRVQAACLMRDALGPGPPGELLCDGIGDSPRADKAELSAWSGWVGPRVSPKRILGEGLMAAGAWQCVAACDAIAQGAFAAAKVSLVGCNQQAVGARFVRG